MVRGPWKKKVIWERYHIELESLSVKGEKFYFYYYGLFWSMMNRPWKIRDPIYEIHKVEYINKYSILITTFI